MSEQVIADVTFEIEQIDQLLEKYTGLLEYTEKGKPSLIEVTALGSVLHSFYNGLENIFTTIAKDLDGDMPDSTQWHRDLLNRMTQRTPKRKSVLASETAEQLADYLSFRHFFRHSYSLFLEWDELEELVTPLAQLWSKTKIEIQAFLNSLTGSETATHQNGEGK